MLILFPVWCFLFLRDLLFVKFMDFEKWIWDFEKQIQTKKEELSWVFGGLEEGSETADEKEKKEKKGKKKRTKEEDGEQKIKF